MDSFKNFLDRWTQPSLIIGFIVVIYGAIVWGNNLTEEALRGAEERGEHIARIKLLEGENRTDQIAMTKTALILERLLAQTEKNARDIATHGREAEKWKRKIMINEQAIENGKVGR